jgi:hypothetical protein
MLTKFWRLTEQEISFEQRPLIQGHDEVKTGYLNVDETQIRHDRFGDVRLEKYHLNIDRKLLDPEGGYPGVDLIQSSIPTSKK